LIFTRNLVIVLSATIVAFSTLYIPQPMLPLLADEFGISSSEAGLLMTATMLPLGLAPVIYGYFLQAIPARSMLTLSLALLVLNQLGFYLAREFWHLIFLRTIQGLLLSAVFTALMTYCASMSESGQIRRNMGFYIGATILGGFLGRAIGGYFASEFNWQTAYVVMGFILIFPLISMRFASADAQISFQRLDMRSIGRVLADRNYRFVYLALSSVFFVYAGILNLIPFRLYEIDPTISPFYISCLYIGYLVGIPIAMFSEPLSSLMRDARHSLLVGLILNALGLIAFIFSEFSILFIMMFCFAGGFFFIHSTLSGLVNHLTREHKGVVNGLYVSIYYFSGALASWLPGIFYDHLGWQFVICLFVLVLLICGCSINQLKLNLKN